MRSRYSPEYLKSFAVQLQAEGKTVEASYILAALHENKRLLEQVTTLQKVFAKTMNAGKPIKKETPTMFDSFLPKNKLHMFNRRDNNIKRED